MNRANDLITYLTKADVPEMLIVAPNAPPVVREADGVRIALTTVFDAQDVTDTLMAMRNRALATNTESTGLSPAGSFSFGIKDLGRFRVNYATQRGSRIMTVVRIPHRLPALESLIEQPNALRKAVDHLVAGRPALLLICGPSALANSMVAYSLLHCVNERARKVLFVLERALTYLMAHGNSIVIQCELGGDVPSLEAGLESCSFFQPDIIYVGDERPGDSLPAVRHAVENGAAVLLSSVLLSEQTLFDRHQPERKALAEHARGIVKGAIRVTAGAAGKWRVEFSEWLPEES